MTVPHCTPPMHSHRMSYMLHFFDLLCTSCISWQHHSISCIFNTVRCVAIHFHAFLASPCITLQFVTILCSSLHFFTSLCIPLHPLQFLACCCVFLSFPYSSVKFFAVLCISLQFRGLHFSSLQFQFISLHFLAFPSHFYALFTCRCISSHILALC